MFLYKHDTLTPPPVSRRNLADMDSDGKMDRLEFSIAMKLIKLKLQGQNLPSSLPIIMKQPPASNSAPTMPSSARYGKTPLKTYISTISNLVTCYLSVMVKQLSWGFSMGVVSVFLKKE